jgi:ribulose-5-phosphate 4-epimerase/fuculose-1-phosphate aldolase
MFERFTEKAIKVIMLAQEEARRLGHNFVGTEQILLGLIGEGTGVAAKVLKSMGVNLKDARVEVEKIIGRGSGFVAVEIPFTPRAKRVLELSLEEARQLGHNYIGTEHLLLGLIREGEGVAARVQELPQVRSLDELLEGLEADGKAPLLLVLDGITDPHNLGACLRVADGAGAHAVIAPKDHAAGINANRAGNVSVRCMRGATPGLLITPTGVAYDQLAPDDLVFLRLTDGRPLGRLAPSSEWRFHRDILRQRPEFGAIVHTHSPAATALACHGRGLPAFHYMVAVAGGHDVRCAPYATFGTQALSDHAVAALAGRRACLLAHHGVIACGATLEAALALAVEIEHLV